MSKQRHIKSSNKNVSILSLSKEEHWHHVIGVFIIQLKYDGEVTEWLIECFWVLIILCCILIMCNNRFNSIWHYSIKEVVDEIWFSDIAITTEQIIIASIKVVSVLEPSRQIVLLRVWHHNIIVLISVQPFISYHCYFFAPCSTIIDSNILFLRHGKTDLNISPLLRSALSTYTNFEYVWIIIFKDSLEFQTV